MATGARTKSNQQQGSVQGKCVTLGRKRSIWASLMAILLFGFLFSHALLHYRTSERSTRSGVEFQGSGESLIESVLVYSQFNPAVVTERERIKIVLKATDFGNISVKDVLFPKASKEILVRGRPRRPKAQRSTWMLPLANPVNQAHMSKFIQLSKTWLGDYGDFSPRVMQDLVQTVKGPLDRNAAYWSRTTGNDEDGLRWGKKYRTCAVVGNSGILLNGSYGEQIDSHEMVIRLNNAQIYQYTKHVGSKTTLSFINSNILRSCSVVPECWCHPYGIEVPIILYICQAHHLIHVARCLSHQRSALLVTNSLLDALCAAIVKWYSVTNFMQTTGRRVSEWDAVHHGDHFHYSSGTQAIVLALGICDSVDIFGFGKSATAKHHYHTAQKEELKLHDYAAEYLFYDDLVHNRSIPFLSDAGIALPPVRIFF